MPGDHTVDRVEGERAGRERERDHRSVRLAVGGYEQLEGRRRHERAGTEAGHQAEHLSRDVEREREPRADEERRLAEEGPQAGFDHGAAT